MKKSIVFLLLLAVQLCFAQKIPMKFISYNILQGMKQDTVPGKPSFVAWVKKQAPDVLALQEVTGFSQQSLARLAASYGHPYASLLTEGIKYPVAITSKYPINGIRKVTTGFDRGLIIAEVKGINVGVLHLTPFDYRKRRTEAELLLSAIKSVEGSKPWVLMGDFNTVSPVDSLAYADGRLAGGYLNYQKKYPPILKLADGRIDYSVIQNILDHGFIDALKLKHPDFMKTVHPKAFSPKIGPDVPSRIDFIFVSADLRSRVSSAAVLVDDFTEVNSDHYPVSVSIAPKNEAGFLPALKHTNENILNKNFYLLALLEKHPVERSKLLQEIAVKRMLRLDSAVRNCVSGSCYADVLQFTPVQIHQIGGELIRYAQKNRSFLPQLRSCGFYLNYDQGIDSAFLRKSWESVALSMNRIFNVYLKGTPPAYPKIDAGSFNPLDRGYIAELKQKLGELTDQQGGMQKSFYRNSLLACIEILLINGRNEAVRYEPLQEGWNTLAFKRISRVEWDKYRYSIILVPGFGPERDGVTLDAVAAKRCDSAAKKYNAGLAPFIVVSGGHVHPNKTPYCEAIEMKKYLTKVLNIPEEAILIEPYARHTTTNLRNLNRMVFNFRIPVNKEVLIVTDESQSRYILGNMAKNAIRDLGYLPYDKLTKITTTESSYLPNKLSLHVNAFDPLDP